MKLELLTQMNDGTQGLKILGVLCAVILAFALMSTPRQFSGQAISSLHRKK